ncbi:MAG: hypothetical protein RIR33_1994, partial [Pseudomonadota bacterium]
HRRTLDAGDQKELRNYRRCRPQAGRRSIGTHGRRSIGMPGHLHRNPHYRPNSPRPALQARNTPDQSTTLSIEIASRDRLHAKVKRASTRMAWAFETKVLCKPCTCQAWRQWPPTISSQWSLSARSNERTTGSRGCTGCWPVPNAASCALMRRKVRQREAVIGFGLAR